MPAPYSAITVVPSVNAIGFAIAGAAIPLVVAVSCNPETFARDARTLVDAGYVLGEVQPIDQFLWSPHVELVAALQRQ